MIQEKQNQKKVDYKLMSDKKCPDCGEPIKQNVANRVHKPKCYVCFKISLGKKIIHRRRFTPDGTLKYEKVIDLKKIQSENRKKNNYERIND